MSGRRGLALGAACAVAFFSLLAHRARSSEHPSRPALSPQAEEHRQRMLSTLAAQRARGTQVWDVALAPSSYGWTAVLSRFDGEREMALDCARIGRDGSLLAPVRTIAQRPLAVEPVIARADERFAVAWIEWPRERSLPQAAWAVVTEQCELALSPRAVSGASFRVSIAANGQSVALMSRTFGSRTESDLAIRSLTGAVIADRRVTKDQFGLNSTVSAARGEWIVAYDSYDSHVARTSLVVVRLDASGEERSRSTARVFDGAMAFLRSNAVGSSATLYWGEDGVPFEHRFDVRAASVVDGALGPSIALSTRRTSATPSLACNDTGCTMVHIGNSEGSGDALAWRVERFDRDGWPVRAPRTLASSAAFALDFSAEIAASASGDAFLSLVSSRAGVFAQRFDAEGRPRGEARPIASE